MDTIRTLVSRVYRTCSAHVPIQVRLWRGVLVQVQGVPVHVTEKSPECVFFSHFQNVDTQINPILHKHVKTTPNSSYNLFSTQIIIQYISFFKTFHDFLPKTILIWVITHTHTKYKKFLRFVLTQTPLLCN